jgi:hypothetical protein
MASPVAIITRLSHALFLEKGSPQALHELPMGSSQAPARRQRQNHNLSIQLVYLMNGGICIVDIRFNYA